jgi:hypothetical protein
MSIDLPAANQLQQTTLLNHQLLLGLGQYIIPLHSRKTP